ncbi:alpha/beta hydrolase [Dyadobacter sp. LHD-138]|uniref:alpha/beta hydrolase n=1 Tax=Dyadobacter sp. LHD-138 TaxID=3071413 RepID=UPI0027E1D6CB|nr:alpha/beta hydrolase [Dyadobacter sp. LHD-138]MDQ6482415.1 alpha/beta hydrolase [Dyadobacter sp. LHD-138]
MEDISKLHYINVGRAGTFPSSGHVEFNSSSEDVDVLFEHLHSQDERKDIVLYFHGGLVPQKAGMKTARYFTPQILTKTALHPISFIWETGIWETLTQNISIASSTKLFKKLLIKVLKVGGDKIGIDLSTWQGVKGIGNMTNSEIEKELEKPAPFEEYFVDGSKKSAIEAAGMDDHTLKNFIEAELEIDIAADPEINELLVSDLDEQQRTLLHTHKLVDSNNSDSSKGLFSMIKILKTIGMVTFRVVKRHLDKRDHGFYPTVVEELLRELFVAEAGTFIWNLMKSKAETMWNEDAHDVDKKDIRVGNYFLNRLRDYSLSNPDFKIHFVGHSAGSIAICHVVNEIVRRQLPVKLGKIIFLAPACRTDLFHESIVKNSTDRTAVRIFSMSDDLECQDHLIPFIYTRSLLYLVSGLLEDEDDACILGMQRYFLGRNPYDNDDELESIIGYLSSVPNSMIFSETHENAEPGFQSLARKHGAFDDEGEPAMDSVIYMLAN